MSKPRILFITPLPPPVHGSAMVSQYIKDCKELQEEFICDFVNLSTSRNIDEIGKKSVMKYIRFIGAYFITFWKLLTRQYSLCYLAITCHGMGFLKDAPFVLLCKLFRRKVIIHQHNKGMSGYVDKQPYKWLLPLVYKNTKVILLSWYLYPDIEKVVKKEQVVICPNGIPEVFDKEPHFERNNEVPHLLFLSNLIPSKGVYVLLDACKLLKEKEEITEALCKAKDSVPNPIDYKEQIIKFTDTIEMLENPNLDAATKNRHLREIVERIDYYRPPNVKLTKANRHLYGYTESESPGKGLKYHIEPYEIHITIK